MVKICENKVHLLVHHLHEGGVGVLGVVGIRQLLDLEQRILGGHHRVPELHDELQRDDGVRRRLLVRPDADLHRHLVTNM